VGAAKHSHRQEVLVSHANARLNQHGRRLLIARTTGPDARPVAHVAAELGISRRCAHKWKRRYDEQGEAGLADRSSRPRSSPTRTPLAVELRIAIQRRRHKRGQARIAVAVGVPASTVHAVLRRLHLNRLDHLDRLSGATVREPIVRYERHRPGELVHVDIKKLGKIRPGGGWKAHGRGSTQDKAKHRTRVGYDFVHTAVDDHSRLAYSEVLPNERADSCTAFWVRAHAFFTTHNITVERVLTDNGMGYRSHAWRDLLTTQNITHKRTRPYRPQTNGKVERLNRTLLTEWAYAREYTSAEQRVAALADYLHEYNHHRAHNALGGLPPIARVTNVPVDYT
jgi:transposase InsO family protein